MEAEGVTLVTVPHSMLQLNEAFALRRQALKSEDCDLPKTRCRVERISCVCGT